MGTADSEHSRPGSAQESTPAWDAEALLVDEEERFPTRARAVWTHQRANNPVYRRYCKAMTANSTGGQRGADAGPTGRRGGAHPAPADFSGGETAHSGRVWERGPFLPVEAFKHAPVTSFPPEEAERVFRSSGTGSGAESRHYVRDLALYERAASKGFARVFGSGPFTLLAHLPGYAERGRRSSLVCMARLLIDRFGDASSGFFLEDRSALEEGIAHNGNRSYPLVLLGAAFGLLDLLEEDPAILPDGALVIETGGMKTHRRAIERSELHEELARGFGVPRKSVYSEYGMCELLSQCYTRGDQIFRPPPWMRLRVVDPEEPERERPPGHPGALAVFDLANVHTVSALLTADRAVRREGGVEILGRLPSARLRGCNFLFEDER